MRIYPAIDIKDGKCVRLFQGKFSAMSVYGDDPVEMAKKWENQGGEYLHVVDLDGALKGESVNGEIIKNICSSVNMKVQTGGGIRTMQDIEYKLNCGVDRVILGSAAVTNEELVRDAVAKYGDKIAVGIDAKEGKVATAGWETVNELDAVEFGMKMVSYGVKTIIYTDISTDGTLAGTNVDAMREMVKATGIDIIASGGIGKIGHVAGLLHTGVEGVIIGKALYVENIDLGEAIKVGEGA